MFSETTEEPILSSPDFLSCEYAENCLRDEHLYAKFDDVPTVDSGPKTLPDFLRTMTIEMNKLKSERDFWYKKYQGLKKMVKNFEKWW